MIHKPDHAVYLPPSKLKGQSTDHWTSVPNTFKKFTEGFQTDITLKHFQIENMQQALVVSRIYTYQVISVLKLRKYIKENLIEKSYVSGDGYRQVDDVPFKMNFSHYLSHYLP